MTDQYAYVIVGAGPAGAAAVEGIRQIDASGSILLVGNEQYLPYNRSSLSKGLRSRNGSAEQFLIHPAMYYDRLGVTIALGAPIVSLDRERRCITDSLGHRYRYGKLLLATGAFPRPLRLPGGDVDGICYFRYLDDYLRLRATARPRCSAVIIGGGYIAAELAAALARRGVQVTMLFPEETLCSRVIPPGPGATISRRYERAGITLMNRDCPRSFTKSAGQFVTYTQAGRELASDHLLIAVGVVPATELAESAGLKTGDGIRVNAFLETSDRCVFAAGDNALVLYDGAERGVRLEHGDIAVSQGRQAGRNMAGARQRYGHLQEFSVHLEGFAAHAVGEVDTALETVADWETPNEKGIIYYLRQGRVAGLLQCNGAGNTVALRALARAGGPLRAAVRGHS